MSEWDDNGEGLQSPAWCEQQRDLVARAISRGWIRPMSEPVPASESALAVNVERKKETRPAKNLHPIQNRSL